MSFVICLASGCSSPALRARDHKWVPRLKIRGVLLFSFIPFHLNLRFLTDADLGGVEKLTITLPRAEYGMISDNVLSASEVTAGGADLLDAHGLIFVKGWSRAVSALTVMLCCFEQTEFLEAKCCGASFSARVHVVSSTFPIGLHPTTAREAWLHVLRRKVSMRGP